MSVDFVLVATLPNGETDKLILNVDRGTPFDVHLANSFEYDTPKPITKEGLLAIAERLEKENHSPQDRWDEMIQFLDTLPDACEFSFTWD